MENRTAAPIWVEKADLVHLLFVFSFWALVLGFLHVLVYQAKVFISVTGKWLRAIVLFTMLPRRRLQHFSFKFLHFFLWILQPMLWSIFEAVKLLKPAKSLHFLIFFSACLRFYFQILAGEPGLCFVCIEYLHLGQAVLLWPESVAIGIVLLIEIVIPLTKGCRLQAEGALCICAFDGPMVIGGQILNISLTPQLGLLRSLPSGALGITELIWFYHNTLTLNLLHIGEPISTNYIKIGIVFPDRSPGRATDWAT